MNEELDDEFILQIKHDFLAEASDLLFKFDSILLQINAQKHLSLDEIRDIFKIIHTLKGNSRAAGFDEFGTFIHKFENLLVQFRDGLRVLDKDALPLLFLFCEKSQESIEIYKKNMEEIINFSSTEILFENSDSTQSKIAKKQYMIAVIDDDASIREIISSALTDEFKANILEFADGKIALEQVNKQKFDLIVVDYQMPVMNGREFLKAVRGQEQINASTPVLFISGMSPELGTDTTMTEDIFYIQKPFDISRVLYYAKCSFLKKWIFKNRFFI